MRQFLSVARNPLIPGVFTTIPMMGLHSFQMIEASESDEI